MARIRTIKPELFEDEVTVALSDAAFRVFIGMIVLADDYGNLRAGFIYLTGHIYRSTEAGMKKILSELAKSGLITLYSVNGQSYASIKNWSKHQRIDNAGKPRVPGPNSELAEIRRENPRKSETRGLLPLDPDPDHRTPTPTPTPTTDRQARKLAVEQVVNHYIGHHPKARPNKDDRGLIAERLDDGYSAADLCMAIDGCHLTPHNCGQNPSGTRYQTLKIIMKDSGQVQRFAETAEQGGPTPVEMVRKMTRVEKILVRAEEAKNAEDVGTRSRTHRSADNEALRNEVAGDGAHASRDTHPVRVRAVERSCEGSSRGSKAH